MGKIISLQRKPEKAVFEKVTSKHEFTLAADKKRKFMRDMFLLRYFEKTAKKSFLNGSVPGPCHVYLGEEAVAVGVCGALKKDDYILSTHRGHGHCLAKGADPKRLLAELYGKKDGYCGGRGGSMHIFIREIGVLGTNGIVGGGIPLSVGAALHSKFKKNGQVSVGFFGDGASNQGTFHESLNLAAIQKLPVIFVCENNLYATATKVHEATLTEDFATRAAGYGMPGFVVDGNDVLDVYAYASKAIKRARSGQGPTLLECKTYRHDGHYVAEETSYRPKEEVEQWLQRDPIERFKRHLVQGEIFSENEINQIEKEIIAEIEQAEKFANQSPLPDPLDITKYVFAD